MTDIVDTATRVAAALGEGWTATELEHFARPTAALHGPDGEELRVRRGVPWRTAERDKLEIQGSYGDMWRYVAYGADPFPSIRVAETKTPERMAADITRRLLPEYRETMAKALDRKASFDTERSAKLDLLSALQGRLGGSVGVDDFTLILPSLFSSVRVTRSDEVEFGLRVDRDKAVALAAWLRDYDRKVSDGKEWEV